MKLRKRAATIGVAAAAVLGTAAVVAPAAQAEGFHNSTMARTFYPWASPTSPGANYWPLNGGSSVAMQCWSTGSFVDGTGKWFLVRGNSYPYTTGYVPANDVNNQWTTSPHC